MPPQQPQHQAHVAREEYREVTMRRDDLAHLPRFELPAGFSLRAYQEGDAAHWTAIHQRADVFNTFSDSTFRSTFGHNEAALVARQKYLLGPDGEPIGTATAWFNPPNQAAETGKLSQEGRVHWVAIVPEFQGKGLAKPLVSAILCTLRDLGHKRVLLSTDSRRPAAIALYRAFGFREVEDAQAKAS